MRHELAPGTLALAVERSSNRKIGDAATTYAAQQSCPRECPFLDGGGCYAETGQLGKFVTAPLNRAAGASTPVAVAEAEARAIDRLAAGDGRPLRLHTVGDCPDEESARIVAGAAMGYTIRGGGPAWAYTHGWRDVPREAWGLVSVLASCETAADVEEAHERGYATAIAVEDFPTDKAYDLGDRAGGDGIRESARPTKPGNGEPPGPPARVIPCPAQTRDRDCTSCRLCFDDGRLLRERLTIGFAIHGIPVTKRRAKLALANPGDPRRRMSLEEQMRELLAEQPTIGMAAAARELGTGRQYAQQLLAHLRDGAKHPSVLRHERAARARRPEKARLAA